MEKLLSSLAISGKRPYYVVSVFYFPLPATVPSVLFLFFSFSPFYPLPFALPFFTPALP